MEMPSASRIKRSGAVDDETALVSIDLDEGERIARGEDDEQDNCFRFMDLGDRVTSALAAGAPPLDTFRLRLTDESSFDMAHRWIRRALARRPASLALRLDVRKRPYYLQRPEFSFDDYCSRAGGVASSTRRLRTLHLRGVTLEREFEGAIAEELPVLEDLRLEKCDYSFARIASASLRNLDIHNCNACAYNVDALVLAAPRLATLRVRGDDPPPVVASDDDGEVMPSLVAASLEHPAGVRGVLRSLHHVTELSLYRFGATALLDDGGGGGEEPTVGLLFPEFHNLRNLVLDECDVGVGCRALRRFLQNAPGLETLALRYCSFAGGSGRSRKREARSDVDDGRRVPASFECKSLVPASFECKSLKSIELEFHEDNDVTELDAALEEIAKKVIHPIESCVQNGRRTVRIRYG